VSLPDKFQVGRLEIDLNAYRLLQDGELVHLTRTEWKLLQEMARHHGQVMPHRALLQRVWGAEYGNESDYIHTYMRRLRVKLEDDPGDPQYLLTEAGIGYRLEFLVDGDPPTAAVKDTLEVPALSNANGADRKAINPLPLDVSERYVGRAGEQAELTNLLLDKTRLITVLGRSGVGKTALACKVLSDLQSSDAIDGLVYLSADRMDINLGRIIGDFAQLLGSDDLAAAVRPDQMTPAQRAAVLLKHLNDGAYILLLDNLEDLQDAASGELTDPDLQTFFSLALEQGGGLRVLVTSRLPLALPRPARTWERVLPLDEGLPLDDGVRLLRLCDPDNTAGLREAADEQLSLVVEKVRGFPRALEAVAGLLLEDQLLTLDDVLSDESLFADEIGAVLVQSAIDRLERNALFMMEALALYERPVTMDALEFLLEPFIDLDHAVFRSVLNRLVRSFFCEYNRATQTFSLHSIDQAYCYRRIPEDSGEYSKISLHRRAAGYYQGESEPEASWTSPADLEAGRQAFHHHIGAGEYDAAAGLLLTFDEKLFMWGQYVDLRAMHERLRGNVDASTLKRQHLLRLGEVYRAVGQVRDAIACYEPVLAGGEAAEQGAALSNLGWAYYDLAQFETAIDYWHEALQVFRNNADQNGEGDVLGGLGWVSYLRGDYTVAADYFHQAWNLLIKLRQVYQAGVNLGDLGVVRAAQGQYDEAIRILNESLSFAEKFNAPREKSYKLGYLATALLFKGEVAEAHETAGMAQKFDVPENNHFIAALYGLTLARLGKRGEAVAAFENAMHYADALLQHTDGLYQVYYARGLAYAGLQLLTNAPLQPAIDDYQRARQLCGETGILENNLRLLDELMQCPGGAVLKPVRATLE
jgi:tetratricopeptide (TPR) repeat protein/DNA-binding winged helix-turn-helix (wHTH) protein